VAWINFTVQNNGANSTVTNSGNGTVVFTGPYNDAVATAQKMNSTSGSMQDDQSAASQPNANPVKSEAAAQESKPMYNTDSTSSGRKYTQQELDIIYKAQHVNVGGNTQKTFVDTINPLDNYSTYTYGISLHVLSRDDYNKFVDTPTGNFTPTVTLISTAGRYHESRNAEFKQDFYFDDLKLETIIGSNSTTHGSNVLSASFTIIEPYGMTLLDRIMEVNNTALNGKNYLSMPYLLEINFFGANDAGVMSKLDQHTKWLPIRILSFQIKASLKGSEYKIDAVPFNHSANLETMQSLKTRMEITAKTLGEYFSNADDPSAMASALAADSEIERQNSTPTATPSTVVTASSAAEAYRNSVWNATGSMATANEMTAKAIASGKIPAGTINSPTGTAPGVRPVASANPNNTNSIPIINANSFTAAYNDWYKIQAERHNIGKADVISFEFIESAAHELSTSEIIDQKKNTSKRIASTDTNTNAKSGSQNAATANFDSAVHDLEPGTTIFEVIGAVIPQSKYFLDQAIDGSSTNKQSDAKPDDEATAQENSKPLKIWKVVPKVKLLEFDNQRNTWAKQVTFFIQPYTAYQQRDDRLPKSPPPNPVKRYDYLYTGKNKSVINFDIEFNALYYTALYIDRNNTGDATGPVQHSEADQKYDKRDRTSNRQQIDQNESAPIAGNYASGSAGAVNRSETLNARSAMESLYSSWNGDMISLRMQIVGDPEFIKQDELYIGPHIIYPKGVLTALPNQYVPGTQSLSMDESEIYCYITFRTPTDFNDETGMYDLNGKNSYSTSEFSGFYRIYTVTSEFKSGKFTQTLELIRQPRQAPVNKSASANTDTNSKGDAQRKKVTPATQQAGNPKSKAHNANPSTDAANVTNASAQNSKGPDGDASANSTAPSVRTSPLSADNSRAVPPADLAKIAKTNKNISYSDINSGD
jgi:hypothetical protein